jgi:RimJ/RimL family protein N-acetyltransferase
MLLGAPPIIKDLERFIAEVRQYRGNRPFSRITCPSGEWRDCLLGLRNAHFHCSERTAYRFCGASDPEVHHREKAANRFVLKEIDFDLAHWIYRQSDRDFYDFLTAWESPEQFLKSGLGYCIEMENEVASIAFSCFPVSGLLEIGTATRTRFRRQGLASMVCSRLIEYCVLQDIEPLWSCYSSNVASNELAKELGFQYDHSYFWLYEKRPRLQSLLLKIRDLARIS